MPSSGQPFLPSAHRVLAVSCGLFHTLALVETSFREAGSLPDVAVDSEASIRRVFTWGVHPLVLRNMMRAGVKGNKYLSPSVVKVSLPKVLKRKI